MWDPYRYAARLVGRPHVDRSQSEAIGPGAYQLKDLPPDTTPAGAFARACSFSAIPYRGKLQSDDERRAMAGRRATRTHGAQSPQPCIPCIQCTDLSVHSVHR